MLHWTKNISNSSRWLEVVESRQIKLDEGQKGCFVRYPGKEEVWFSFEKAESVAVYESVAGLEDWYIEGNDVYVKEPGEPTARQHIGHYNP